MYYILKYICYIYIYVWECVCVHIFVYFISYYNTVSILLIFDGASSIDS